MRDPLDVLRTARSSDKLSKKNDALEWTIRLIEKMEGGYDMVGAARELEGEDENAQ